MTILLNYAEKYPQVVLKSNASNFKVHCAASCKVRKIKGGHPQLDLLWLDDILSSLSFGF